MNICEESIRIMTFNIRYKNDSDVGCHSWDKRKESITDLIYFHRPDVIGLQETLKDQLDYIDTKLKEYSYFGIGRDDGKERGEYSPIFYVEEKFERLNQGYFWLSETPEEIGSIGWDAALTRIVTWVKLQDKKTEQVFFVFNGHFDHFGKQAAEESALLVLKKINEIAGKQPVLFMGDLNNTPVSKMYNILIQGGLKDCMDDYHYGNSYSFIGFDPVKLYYEQNYKGINALTEENGICKIDYIFYKNDVSILQYGILSDNFSGIFPSDHMPAIADILLCR